MLSISKVEFAQNSGSPLLAITGYTLTSFSPNLQPWLPLEEEKPQIEPLEHPNPRTPEASNPPSTAWPRRRSSHLASLPVKQTCKGKSTKPVHIPDPPFDLFQASDPSESAHSHHLPLTRNALKNRHYHLLEPRFLQLTRFQVNGFQLYPINNIKIVFIINPSLFARN